MLPKKPDRRKTYWKVTNEDECHYGLQYKTGLVIDPVPFNNNPDESCVEGGIYFTTREYIHRFFWVGTNLRPVKIPKDAKVVLDPEGDKYRADRVILREKKSLDYYFDHLFNKDTFQKNYYKFLAKYCPKHFDKWFDKKTFYKKDYWYLVEYCPEHFDKWFDKDTFPKIYYRHLAKYCTEYFDKWFDKNTFPKKDYWYLIKYCSEHFNKWFDKKTFPKEDYWALERYCKEYKHIWKE